MLSIRKRFIQRCILVFLVVPALWPTDEAVEAILGYNFSSIVSISHKAWYLLSLCCVIFLFLVIKKVRVSAITLYAVLLFTILSISSFINDFYNINYIIDNISGILLLFGIANVWKYLNFKDYVYIWYVYITISMLINSTVIFLLYPNGLYSGSLGNSTYYLYGLDNLSFMYSYIGFILGLIYNIFKQRCKNILHIVCYIYIFGAYIYTDAGTAKFILLATVLVCVVFNRHFIKDISSVAAKLFIASSFVLIVCFSSLNLYTPILNALNKDETFSGRTYLWSAVFKSLRHNYILGYGLNPNSISHVLYLYAPSWMSEFGHFHNVVLQYLFCGGIIAAVVVFMIWFKAFDKYYSNEKMDHKSQILLYSCLLWLCFMFEFRINTNLFWLIPCTIYYLDIINTNKDSA